MLVERFGVDQVHETNTAPGGLVFVAGSDAPAGGADLLIALHPFTTVVDQFVIGHDHVGPVADHENVGTDGNPLGFQVIDLFDQDLGVHDDPVADHADFLLKDPGRDQVADKLFAIHNHGVAGVVATLEPDHHVGVSGQKINDFSFSLITPLGAYNHDICHEMLLHHMINRKA